MPENKTGLSRLLIPQTRLVVEVGSWKGKSARHIVSNIDADIICVDTWLGSAEMVLAGERVTGIYEEFLHNLWAWRHRVIPLRLDSVGGLTVIAGYRLSPDLLYIDGSHLYETVLADVGRASYLFPRATLCGDDWKHKQVKAAVSEALSGDERILHDDGNFWWTT